MLKRCRSDWLIMQRISAAFDRLRREGRKALIPFIVGGDPTRSMTESLLLTLEDAGADLIEVGIPFSDPLADGPTIQAAAARALAHGTTPETVLDAVAAVRQRLTVPVVGLSYWNPIAQFSVNGLARGAKHAQHRRAPVDMSASAHQQQPADGSYVDEVPRVSDFLRRAHESGLSGLIIPDLPIEESRTLRQLALREQIASIFLAAPTSSAKRLRAVAQASQGFIYYVSVTGTTGVRRELPPQFVRGVRQLQRLTTKPICVGFGISTPAQVTAVAKVADGVIIGSALIRAVAEGTNRAAKLRRAGTFLRQLRRGLPAGPQVSDAH